MGVEISSSAGFGISAVWDQSLAEKLADRLGIVDTTEREDLAFSPAEKLNSSNLFSGISWDLSVDQWSGTFPTRLVAIQAKLGSADKHSAVKDGLQGLDCQSPSEGLLKAKKLLEEIGLEVSGPWFMLYSSVL